jgi:hypothetical protein
MKRAEVLVAKTHTREAIASLQSEIKRIVFGSGRIPDRILNASIQETHKWKDEVELAADLYHVNHQPGKTLTLPALLKVKDRLEGVIQRLN